MLKLRQTIFVFVFRRSLILIGLQKAWEGDGSTSCRKLHALACRCFTCNGQLHRLALGIFHLRCHGALPNQLIKLKFLSIQLTRKLARGCKGFTSRTNRFVCFLRVFHLAVITTRARCRVFLAEVRHRCITRCGQPLLRQRGRVSTHIGNVTVFVQSLRNTHGALRGKVQTPPGFLLQSRCHKRCIRLTGIRLVLDRSNVHGSVVEAIGKRLCTLLIQHDYFIGSQLAVITKITALSNALAINTAQACLKLRRIRCIRILRC